MRVESSKCAQKKWKLRKKKVFHVLVEACGGQKDGIVSFLGKPVRADYLRQAVNELTRDQPHGKTIFYRALPINVEAWLRSLCEFSIATYVPNWWRSRESARMRHITKHATFARIGILNQVQEAETPLLTLAMSLSYCGVEMQRVTKETFSSLSSGLLRSDESPVSSLQTENDFFHLGARKRDAILVAHLRPTQSVEYEEVVGLLFRRGVVTCTGSYSDLIFGTFTEESGNVVKRLKGAMPYYLADHIDKCANSPLWTMELGAPTFLSDNPLQGADCVLKLSEGLCLRTIMALDTEECSADSFSTFNAISKAVSLVLRRNTREKENESLSRTSSITENGTSIVAYLCQAVKRKHLGSLNLGEFGESGGHVPRMTQMEEWVGSNFIKSVDLVPKKCRNAWVTTDGMEVERTDLLITQTIRKRRRWPSVFVKCHMCPELHVDERIREEQGCGSTLCKGKFVSTDYCTHFVFKGSKRKRMEVDKNAHLFTDAALRELERCTDFVIHSNRNVT